MKLQINHTSLFHGERIISHTIERDVIEKTEHIYGIDYTLKCGWYVTYDNKFKRWEVEKRSTGEHIGRFNEDDIIEINN